MLYIFHVDTGATLTFDIKLALQSVAELKEAIERKCGVLAAHQVLLMSGGESLEPNARVCSYSAGTDTNPIYLFSKAAIESQVPPTPHTDYSSDVDLVEQINASLAMPATYATLVARAQLAQQCCMLAREQTRTCERLVHDQHLQQQGWAAVVANLEDITQMFQSRAEVLQQSFTHYLTEREQHMQLLNNFTGDLGTLSKIPILPALRAQAEGILNADDQPADDEISSSDDVLSLLKWISAKDNQSSLEQVAEQCSRGLEQFDARMMESLKAEVNSAIETANIPEMKEIKGLGERLFSLEQLMAQSKKLVQEQVELAQGFSHNQTRASNLGDASVLPDLCASHRRQLIVMMENHSQLRDIRRRCTKAKEELSVNIYHRLKWIMYVENKMMEVDGKLVMYHESLKRLRRHLEVVQQIHLAPQMYVGAVAEVVRRRTFSQAFLVWASNLACQLLTVHNEELARRREFQNKFDGHFLNTLFPGLEDTPPPFATQAPTVFDSELPKLTIDDMESLKDQLPDLADSMSTPDLNSITQFFLSKSLTEASSDGNKEKESTSMPVDLPVDKETSERIPMVADRVGFESETDTEEFEKIGQISGKLRSSGYEESKLKLGKQLEVGDEGLDEDVILSATTRSSPTSSLTIIPRRVLSPLNENHEFTDNNINIDDNSKIDDNTNIGDNSKIDNDDSQCPEKINSVSVQKNLRDANFPSDSKSRDDAKLLKISSSPTQNNPLPNTCDGKQKNYIGDVNRGFHSGGSSPANDTTGNDFVGTEFYMDESLPSSLSEHPNEAQHQAIVSLLQDSCDAVAHLSSFPPQSLYNIHHEENLGNTRAEVERLRGLMRGLKSSTTSALTAFRDELSSMREKVSAESGEFNELTDRVRQALVLHSRKCEDALREREQELTVDHELEMADVKKLLENRDEELRSVYDAVREVESELADREYLINSLKQKLDEENEDMRNLQERLRRELEEAMEVARLDKETAVKETREKREAEIEEIRSSLERCQETVRELEDSLAKANLEQQRAVKEATDKLQMEYKSELDTIRTRFKMVAMATSTMERSPSDSSLEKIERPDIMERASHEAILAKVKAEMEVEKDEAIRKAIEKENSDFQSKLDDQLRIAQEQIAKEAKAHRLSETALVEDCQRFQRMIRRFTDGYNELRQSLNEKVENLEEEKNCLQSEMMANRVLLEMREKQIHDLESEREALRQELSKSQPGNEEAVQVSSLSSSSSSKDEIEASESKKFRLESKSEENASRRLELLEEDNKRLTAELRLIRESKESIEAKVEALEADKIRLEIELIKERSGRSDSAPSTSTSLPGGTAGAAASPNPGEKDMTASVAIVSEASSVDNVSNPDSICRLGEILARYRDILIKNPSATPIIQNLSISFTRCDPGDNVLVVWDSINRHFSVVQDSRTLYILHSECVESLDAWMNGDESPKAKHIFGKVIDKQYCHAKKTENRYNVPKGTKFYRVRIKPVIYVS